MPLSAVRRQPANSRSSPFTPGTSTERCAPACGAPVGADDAPLLPPAPAATGAPILRVRGLGKRYRARGRWFGRQPPVDAVVGLELDLHPGEFVGIVGESGSGKSTVARLLVGLAEPSAGTIAIDGRPLRPGDPAVQPLRRDTLQMVFQDPQSALNPRRPVAALVTQALEAGRNRTGWPERLARAKALLGLTGLPPEAAGRFPAQLSGGQRQRVNIARALCSEPRVLIADEIVSGLDVSVQAQVLNLLLTLREQRQIALLLISHDLSVVRYLCSRVLVMSQGRVVESGPTEAVFAAPSHSYTRALLAAVPPDDPDAPWPPSI